MKPIEGYELVNEAGDFKTLPPMVTGVRITKVVDNPEREYMEIYCDIVKGEYKDYFKTLVDAGLKDTSRHIRSYKPNALPFFKAFITAVEKSNQGYKWDWDEQKLVGKNVIAIFGEEEYVDNNGDVKVATKIQEFRSLEAWKEGKLQVPSIKKLTEEEIASARAALNASKPTEPQTSANLESLEIPDSELPF